MKGAMSACALFINGWPVEKCITYFETAAAVAFEQRRTIRFLQTILGSVPVLLPLAQFVVSLLGDSKYSAERLEKIQQDVYGPICSIFDRISPYPNQPSGQGSQPESSTSAHQSQWQPATQTGPTINPTLLPEAPTYQQFPFPLVDPTNQQYAQQYAFTISPDARGPQKVDRV